MGHPTELLCARCGEKYPLARHYRPCVQCGAPLLLAYDLEKISDTISRDLFAGRESGVWRYLELLPNISQRKIVSLGEGGTALLECERLARTLSLKKVFVKDETTNPTGSFLDRGMTVDLSRANDLGFRSLRCMAVSGNFAASASAYASRAGLDCAIHLPKRSIERIDLGKLYQIIAYGANLIAEDESTSDQSAFDRWSDDSYILSPSNPYFAEGEKTTAYEICEQLGWRIPDRIIVPMGHGEHLSMIWKGINELEEVKLIRQKPVAMTGVQVGGHAGIVESLGHGRADASLAAGARTVASDLAMKKPTHAHLAIRSIKESGGSGITVKDTEVLKAMALLARTEGIFAEPAAASTIAGLKMLIERGDIDRSEEIVCVITGAGLKDPYTARRFLKKSSGVERIVSHLETRKFTTRLGRTKLDILRAIADGDTYGYELWRRLKKMFGVSLDISSIYQHLYALEIMGLISRTRAESVLGKPKRCYYHLTNRGRTITKSAKAEELD